MENYEPDPSDAVSAVAEASGREAAEVAYDMMCHSKDGSTSLGCLWRPVFANRPDGTYNPSLQGVHNTFMDNEHAVPGVADAGAHGTMLTDAVSNTTLLAHYVRDREAQMPIELAVMKSSLSAAQIYGLDDRGVLLPGKKADSECKLPSFCVPFGASTEAAVAAQSTSSSWTSSRCISRSTSTTCRRMRRAGSRVRHSAAPAAARLAS